MGTETSYDILLPEGNADRAYYQLSESERIAVGIKIFERAKLKAEKIGAKPVVGSTSSRKVKATQRL
jgi:hypothetical protein